MGVCVYECELFFLFFSLFFVVCLVLSYACVCSRYMTMCLCTINRVHCCALTQSTLVEFIQSLGNPVSIYTRTFCVPFAALCHRLLQLLLLCDARWWNMFKCDYAAKIYATTAILLSLNRFLIPFNPVRAQICHSVQTIPIYVRRTLYV